MKPLIKPTDAIIIDSYNRERIISPHALGLPLNPDGRVFSGWAAGSQRLEDFIRAQHSRSLVYSGEGIPERLVHLPEKCSPDMRIGDLRMDCFQSNTIYHVYQIEFSGEESLSVNGHD